MRSPKPSGPFRVVAIVSAFNEVDVISPVIGHLVENGVDVYLIDNHSTDGTADAAKGWLRKGLLGIEQFPAEPPAGKDPPAFDWEGILRRKEALAKELSADWFIHHDADEFREAPWPGMNLRDAIRWVDRLGYNCIDFRVLNFPPLENGFRPGSDPARHFTHWEDPVIYDTLQLKCWKAQKAPVSLAASGGHEARFPGRRVFPIRFLLRHYPIRSQEHGHRKVFDERKKRFVEKERAKGWHVQYDSISDESHSFLGDPLKLQPYDPDRIRLDLMLESEAARAAEGKARELSSLVEAVRLELAGANAARHEAEKHGANLERDREKLTAHLVDRERHIANLETLKAEAERYAASLDAERREIIARLGERETQVSDLEGKVGELQRHASGLETDRNELAARIVHLEEVREDRERRLHDFEDARVERERHAANLETTVVELQRHAAGFERDRDALANHVALLEHARAGNDRLIAELGEARAERERHIGHLEAMVAELERHAAGLEKAREILTERVTMLESSATEKDRRIADAERSLQAFRSSRSWRWMASLRRLLDARRH